MQGLTTTTIGSNNCSFNNNKVNIKSEPAIMGVSVGPPAHEPPCDDLTPLSWLHSLNMDCMVPHLATPPTPPASPQPHNGSPGSQQAANDRKRKAEAMEASKNIDYSVDGSIKPPYSYAALIGMAMKANQNKMTLSAIYKWIKENFAYYKTADPSWQNSIRHNLSLNKCFLKLPRSKDEPGKGGFWRLDPEYADSLVDGVFKKRRPTKPTAPPPTKLKKSRTNGFHQQLKVPQQQQAVVGSGPGMGVKVLVQPVPQAAFMPPPTNKPPPMSTLFLNQEDHIDWNTCSVVNVQEDHKDPLAWGTMLVEEHIDDWHTRTQELITDLGQTGDPASYPDHVLSTFIQDHQAQSQAQHNQQIVTLTTSASNNTVTLPSFELSPASLGVDEDFFTSPDISEASNDANDCFTPPLDFNHGTHWIKGNYGELPPMSTFCSGLANLTPLEPAAPVLVQDAHAHCWGPDGPWDEAKTLSVLDANLDFDRYIDNFIDLDVL
ncbi:unnamed protein product, partial [Meganyctiphanes norvegica]